MVQSGVHLSILFFRLSVKMGVFCNQKLEGHKFGTYTPQDIFLFRSLLPTFSDLWAKVHFSILTIYMEKGYIFHLFDLQVCGWHHRKGLVTLLEFVSNDLDPHLKVKEVKFCGVSLVNCVQS